MTPKEKAKELVDKFYQFFPLNKDVNTTDGELSWEYNDWSQAKQCALNTIDQILINIDFIWADTITTAKKHKFEEHKEYWQEVKHEIEQL